MPAAGADQQADHHAPAAQGLRQPKVIQIDQHQRQQQRDQGETSPGEPEIRQPPTSTRPAPTAPRSRGRALRASTGWVAPADRCITVAAAAPQQQPTQHREIVMPADGMAAFGAVAAGKDHRFLAGQAPGHHVGEAADAGAQQAGPSQDQPFHRSPTTARAPPDQIDGNELFVRQKNRGLEDHAAIGFLRIHHHTKRLLPRRGAER